MEAEPVVENFMILCNNEGVNMEVSNWNFTQNFTISLGLLDYS